MKKVLFISPNYIFGYSGGSISQRRIYDGLKNLKNNNKIDFKTISLDNNRCLEVCVPIHKSKRKDIISRILGHSNYLFTELKKIKKEVKEYRPDIIILGSSRLGFIAKELKKINVNIDVFTNFDNVEYDYVNAYFIMKKGVKGKILKLIEKLVVYNDEKLAVKYSEKLIFLTQRDEKRIKEIYKLDNNKNVIIPICIEQQKQLIINNKKKSIVFLGSLNYGSNVDAIIWFIENVWRKYYDDSDDIKLIVAGSNADCKLIELVNNCRNIKLFNGFKDLIDVVPINSLLIAPIRVGAGMKVKIAEALSLGISVAASKEALIGYEEGVDFQNKKNINIINEANTEEEYKKCIDNFVIEDESILLNKGILAKKIFEEKYSYKFSRNIIEKILFNK